MPATIVSDFRTELLELKRPAMPSRADDERSQRQWLRWRMLNHRFDEDAADFFEAAYGPENARVMGIPDTTLAPLPAQTAQLTTPGLYQTPPEITHETPDAPGVLAMIDPLSGVLAQAAYWTRMQDVMYHAVGIGNYAVRINVREGLDGEPRPVIRAVMPHNLVVWCHPDDELQPVKVAELRIRHTRAGSIRRSGYFWDVFDLMDPDAPTFAILNASNPDDRTNYAPTFLDLEDGAYPWRTPEGRPFIPYVWHRARDSGAFWDEYRPALRHGTLRAVANWTMVGQAALWSQGNHNLVGGVDPMALPAETQAGNARREEGYPIRTLRNTPGTVSFLPVEDDRQLQLLTMTTGVDLARMLDFANTYSMNLATVDGINPSDATRRSANPTSGAALAISQADKRAFAASVTPVFRRNDLDAIRKLAWLMTAATGREHVADGYSITYKEIPLTPTEQADQRAQLEWEEVRGQRSPIGVYLALHPGTTREQAIRSVVRARVDEARIDALVAEEVEALGAAGGAGGASGDAEPQKTAMGGAQIAGLQAIVTAVAAGEIPREAGAAMISVAFPLTREQAEEVLADAGAGFEPASKAAPAPAPPPFGGAPPPPGLEPPDDDENTGDEPTEE